MTDILQFGTSRFLQAHADLFFSESTEPRQVTVVQSSGDPARQKRLAALANPAGYPVHIRGLVGGQEIDEVRTVTSVKRTLSTATDWTAVQAAVNEAKVIISNTADNGFLPRPADGEAIASQDMSYPAKLYHLLVGRFEAGAGPVLIMPTELISNNGNVLKARILEIAQQQGASDPLLAWLNSLPFANSLVDRIVSEALEPAGAVAEPYALWAIEKAPGVSAPCPHPCIQMVDDLESVARLKLHILNLGHTVLAELWRSAGSPADALVREAIHGPDGKTLADIWDNEVLPCFASRGMRAEAEKYMDVTLERFKNPFLDHRLSEIANNHQQKIERRIGALIDWAGKRDSADMTRLKHILAKAQP